MCGVRVQVWHLHCESVQSGSKYSFPGCTFAWLFFPWVSATDLCDDSALPLEADISEKGQRMG